MTIDDAWSLIGSANWDNPQLQAELRLNVEVQDEAFSPYPDRGDAYGTPLTKAEIDAIRCRSSCATTPPRLLQPYL